MTASSTPAGALWVTGDAEADVPVVTVVDSGTGNFGSITNMLRRVGARTILATTPEMVLEAQRLVLPGVGAFDTVARTVQRSGLSEALVTAVDEGEIPLLGVCVGMQLLADSSDEGVLPGLGLIPGTVRRFDVACDDPPERIPHVGWKELAPTRQDALLSGIDEPRFYFTHSYRMICGSEDTVATAHYGCDFAAVVRRGCVWGAQFHPEKSGRNGLQFFRNFLQLSRAS
jgi:imidazole glycerol-phosphate synthase subunit HisH